MTGDGDDEKLEVDAGDGADDKTNKRKAASRSSRAATQSKKGKTATEGAGEDLEPHARGGLIYFTLQPMKMFYLFEKQVF